MLNQWPSSSKFIILRCFCLNLVFMRKEGCRTDDSSHSFYLPWGIPGYLHFQTRICKWFLVRCTNKLDATVFQSNWNDQTEVEQFLNLKSEEPFWFSTIFLYLPMIRPKPKVFPYCLICLYSAPAEAHKNLALQRISTDYVLVKKDYIKYTMGVWCAKYESSIA